MIRLEETFTSGAGGFNPPLTYKQLCRNESVAVYERYNPDGRIKDYEVFNIQVHQKGKMIFNQVLEEDREVYPGSSQFGQTAWSFGNVGAAMDRFKRLTQIAKGETPDPLPVIMSTRTRSVNTDTAPGEAPKATIAPQKAPVGLSKVKELNLPDGEFTVKGLAEFNSVSYPTAYLFVQAALQTARVKFVRDQKGGRGKPTKIYVKS